MNPQPSNHVHKQERSKRPGATTIQHWSPTIPNAVTCLWLTPLLAALIIGSGALCGWLKTRRRMRTGDTRKIFHFSVFTTAAVVSLTLGLPGVNLLGGLMAAYIALILRLGDGHPLYEALAREQDRPRRSLYIVLPFIATAVGGVLAAALFGPFAVVGIAVGGWGDAVAEPIGIRFGRHRYRVPNFGGGVISTRSLEGSAAVFLASLAGVLVVLPLLGVAGADSVAWMLTVATIVAAAATLVEAISHHGLDNLTLQVVAASVAFALCA